MAIAWSAFLAYVAVTFYLAWLGHKKTTSLESYALGDGAMNPMIVGLALAASMTSTATFVINPGIVYVYGLSAVLGYGVAASLGLVLGLVIMSKAFRKKGTDSATKILTVPQWLGQHFGGKGLTVMFALTNLLLIAMVVLICYAMAGLLQAMLDLPSLVGDASFEVALAIVVVFVFSYVFFGGTYAHAYTNTAQGVVMIVVAVALIASGADLLFGGEMLDKLGAVDPNLASATNPSSVLFRDLFEVFGANFAIGFALALQPHFLIKALYVKSDKDVNRYLTVAVVVGIVFNLVLLCGLFARLDPTGEVAKAMAAGGMGIDGVMPAYIVSTFDGSVAILVAIAILAAGMSTLDGVLVALSAIVANDLYLNLRRGDSLSEDQKMAAAFKVSKWTLAALGVLAYGLSLYQHHHKEFSIAIFAQEGVYALLASSFVPLLFALTGRRLSAGAVVATAMSALFVHFGFRYGEWTLLTDADYTNPALTATWALIVSTVVALVGSRAWAPRTNSLAVSTTIG